jgi:ankyrin repeat protein
MPIHEDVQMGNVASVARHLDEGVWVDTRDPEHGITPLMAAVVSENAGLDMVRLLLERGADIHAVAPEDSQNVLALAVRQGTLEKVEVLLDAGADIHYRTETGYDVLINAVHSRTMAEGETLLPLIELLLERGASPLGESDWGESALSVSSRKGRFDVVERLLAAGADPALLDWNELMHAVAIGTVEEVRTAIAEGGDVTALDRWERTPWLLSLHTGDLDKVQLLAEVSDPHAAGRCGKTALMHAIESEQVEVLSWLIEQGTDVDGKDEFGGTALMMAAEQGATECVRRLLQAGASINPLTTPEEKSQKASELRASLEAIAPDIEALTGEAAPDLSGIDFEDYDYEDEKTIHKAANLDIVRLLVEAGEELSDISDEMRAELTGLESEGEIECTREEYLAAKHRRFGTSNPEVMAIAFWQAMVRSGATAYSARDEFGDTVNYQDEAVWCFHRFGKSITELPDGRIIEIGGEHEDSYDTDFCIYNEVFVHHGGGVFEILGYPTEVFPPTDFHSATLVGEFIYIIGCLGYPEARISGETPVYRLHCQTLVIEKVETSGQKPGWISRHKAVHQPGDSSEGEIQIWGGKVCMVVDGEEDYSDNPGTYVLNLKTLSWRQTESDAKA